MDKLTKKEMNSFGWIVCKKCGNMFFSKKEYNNHSCEELLENTNEM